MLWAASIRLPSISRRLCSTMRATKGAADTTSGTMAPGTPRLVPTTKRVKGMMATNRMMKGIDRPMLTIQPRIRLQALWGHSPSSEVMVTSTPKGMPNT